MNIIVFLLLAAGLLQAQFMWNPEPASVGIFISPNPACPGNYDLTIGGTLYPCFGTGVSNVVTEQMCPNGLHGIMINDTLTCGVITEYIGIGQQGCVNGGYRFLSNTQNFTQCYGVQTYMINSTSDGLSIISSSSFSSTMLKSFTNSPSITWFGTATSVSANAIITATDVTSGYASILAGCVGANCNYKQLRGENPALIDVYQDSTTVIVKSNLKAQNLPYPNISAALFPDCPLATTQADINVCLAGRTLPNLNNYTNARQVLYTPAIPVLGQSNITVADGFDVIFINSQPSFTRVWNVDPYSGNDVIGDGSPIAPFKTIAKVFNSIGTFTWSQAQMVSLAFGAYIEGPLQWPPNTFVVGESINRAISISSPNITLRADWATAGPHVEGGLANVRLMSGVVFFDFTIMGVRPLTSVAHFAFGNNRIDSSVTCKGGGSTDYFRFSLNIITQAVLINCANIDWVSNIFMGANTITDTACSATQLSWHILYNYIEGGANTTISQSTSTSISLDMFVTSWDGGFLAVYAVTPGALTLNSFTLPLYGYVAPTVNLKLNLNLASAAIADLDPAYWGATLRNGFQMMNTLAGRAKTANPTGLGTVQLLYSSTITDNYFNDMSSSSPAVTLSASGGIITIGFDVNADIYFPAVPFRGLSSFSIQYGFNVLFEEELPSYTGIWWIDPIHGDDSLGSGAYNNKLRTIGQAFNLIGTFPFLQMQTVMLVPGYYAEGNLQWPPNTFVKSIGSMENTLVVISGANVDLRSDWSVYANDIVEGGIQDVQWKCDKFTIDYAGVEGASGGYSNSRFTFTRTVMDALFTINGRGNMDHVDFLLTDVAQPITTNCLDMNIQSSKFQFDFTMNDSPCSVSDIFINMQDNYFYDASTFVLKQTDSTNFKITSLYNSFSTVTMTQYYGKPTLYTNGLPLNVFIDTNVVLINDFNTKAVIQSGLPTPYFASTTMNLDDILLTIVPRAKDMIRSNAGTASLIFSSTTTTNTMNDVSGTNFQVSTTPSGGVITFSIPSDFRPPGIVYFTSATGISASGTTQGTATALSSTILVHVITTVAASSGVRLPTPATGGVTYTIINRGANTLNVYPAVGGTIDAAGTNVAVVIPAGTIAQYTSISSTQWYTTQPIPIGAGGITFTFGNGIYTATMTSTPSFSSLSLSTPLPVSSGGTGGSSLTANGMLFANPSGSGISSTVMAIGTVPIGTGGAPAFATLTAGPGVTITNAAGSITISSPATRADYSSSATLTTTNPGAATFTPVSPTGIGSLTYAADTLFAGSKICVRASGTFASATATTVNFRWFLDGTTAYGPSTSVTPGAVSAQRLTINTCFQVQTQGISGTALPAGEMQIGTANVAFFTSAVATTFNTAIPHTFALQMSYSTLNAANTFTILQFYTEHMRNY